MHFVYIRVLAALIVALSLANSRLASGGPCSLESPKAVALRSTALHLARVEVGVINPFAKVLTPEISEQQSRGTFAEDQGDSLKFDAFTRKSLDALAKMNFGADNLSPYDKLKLLIDPLRLQPAKLDVKPVPNKPWPQSVERATAGKATPYYQVGPDGTRDLSKINDKATVSNSSVCEKKPGRPRDPACFLDIPSPQIYPVGAPAVELGQRRTALANLATVLLLIDSLDGQIQICTGSHLGNGIVLTAHHCHRNGSFVAARYHVF
jgi:hypothetical protein